jgi:hypothetical protein
MSMSINSEHKGGYASGPGLTEGQAVTWNISPKPADTPIRQAHNIIAAVRREHDKFLEQVETVKSQFTPEGYQHQLGRFSGSQAAQGLDQAERIIAEREAQAEHDYAATFAALSPKLDVAGELRADRALRHAEKAIEAAEAGAVGTTVYNLLAHADEETRGALLNQLPGIAASKGVGAEVVNRAAEDVVPQLGEAARKVSKARQSSALLRAEIRRERDAIANGRKPYVGQTAASRLRHYDPDAS